MVIGSEKAKNKLANEIEKSPLMLAGKKMKLVPHLKFHGEESAHLTVKRRLGIASYSVFEIRAVVDDVRTTTLGGVSLSFMLWRS